MLTDDIPELTDADFARMITRAQRLRLMAGDFQPGDIAAFRRFCALTSEALADRMGVTADTMRDWEHDIHQPDGPARALIRLCTRHPRLIREELAHSLQEIV